MDSLIWAASRLSTEGNSARPRRKLWAAMGAAAPDPIPRDRVYIPVFSRWLICADCVEKIGSCRGTAAVIQSGPGDRRAADDGGTAERAGRSVLRVFARTYGD